MKLHLSREELCGLLSLHFGQTVDKVVIKRNIVPDNLYNRIMDKCREDCMLDENDNILPHRKAWAIQLVQKLFPPKNGDEKVSLTDAKWAVDNWRVVKSWIKVNNAYPILSNFYRPECQSEYKT